MRTDDDAPVATAGTLLERGPGTGGDAPPGSDEPGPAPLVRPVSGEAVLDVLIDIDEGMSVEAEGWLPSRAFIADWTARALAELLDADAPDTDGLDTVAADEAMLDERPPGALRPVRHELSVRMLAPETMRVLNRDWRERDRPTNVLSFPAGLPALPLDGGGSVQVLGDLAFCPAVIACEAHEQGKPLEAHWAHLVVHGVLHLRGLDHEGEGEAADMEALERRLLSLRDIPDPYLARVPDGGPLRHD